MTAPMINSEPPEEGFDGFSPAEERLNVWTHGFGFLLSLLGLVLLVLKASDSEDALRLWTSVVFGLSLPLLYLASTVYHSAKTERLRYRLQVFDHAAIYLLIAGTYTPFTLVALPGPIGNWIFGIVWGMAALGIFLKLFYTGRFVALSTAMYVAMGWLIIFAVEPLAQSLPAGGMDWLMAGGISYTVGAAFFLAERLRYNHAVFHILVLGGSFCHYWTVYFYVV